MVRFPSRKLSEISLKTEDFDPWFTGDPTSLARDNILTGKIITVSLQVTLGFGLQPLCVCILLDAWNSKNWGNQEVCSGEAVSDPLFVLMQAKPNLHV